jgi:hypothetical protein
VSDLLSDLLSDVLSDVLSDTVSPSRRRHPILEPVATRPRRDAGRTAGREI